MIKLSIVIPVYNVEKYIWGTLSSIYTPNCDESCFEVIVVNDGTPDNSMEKVASFASRHSNLKVINQENKGLSCARNAGLDLAAGKYIWFVDSDDKLAPNGLKLVMASLCGDEFDIVGFDVKKVCEATLEERIDPPFFGGGAMYNCVYSGKQIAKWMHIGMVQRFVFRRDFLKNNDLFFLPDIYYEDNEFMVKAIVFASRIFFVNEVSYLYLVRSQGSIMSEVKRKSLEDVITIVNSWKAFAASKKNNRWASQYVCSNILTQVCWNILIGSKTETENIAKLYKEKRNEWKKMMVWSFLRSGKFISASKTRDFFRCFFA